MKNNFEQWHESFEGALPPEIEARVLHQARTFATFGKVVELYVPNALGAVAMMISGEANTRPDPKGPDTGMEDDVPFWRIPPGRYR
jgi:hypothetical protein